MFILNELLSISLIFWRSIVSSRLHCEGAQRYSFLFEILRLMSVDVMLLKVSCMRVFLVADLAGYLDTFPDMLYVFRFVVRVKESDVSLQVPLTRA